MKNNIIRSIIAVVGLVGYYWLFVGASQMKASVIIMFVFCWTAFVLGILFAFSPEIKRLVFKKDKLELDRYKQQVDKALVEYKDFKETIYPLLKITMSEIAFDNYLGVPARPDDLIDFLNRVEKLPLGLKNDDEIKKSIESVEVKTVATFNDQLSFMREKNGLPIDTDKYVSINYPQFSEDRQVTKDDVGVDFEGLEKSADKIKDLAEKARYKRKIKQFEDFYKKRFQ